MKRINVLILLILSFLSGVAQNNATDFTALDCDGVSHHLFSGLDSGTYLVKLADGDIQNSKIINVFR